MEVEQGQMGGRPQARVSPMQGRRAVSNEPYIRGRTMQGSYPMQGRRAITPFSGDMYSRGFGYSPPRMPQFQRYVPQQQYGYGQMNAMLDEDEYAMVQQRYPGYYSNASTRYSPYSPYSTDYESPVSPVYSYGAYPSYAPMRQRLMYGGSISPTPQMFGGYDEVYDERYYSNPMPVYYSPQPQPTYIQPMRARGYNPRDYGSPTNYAYRSPTNYGYDYFGPDYY
eukprot:TRINITY_DN10501_c0_g1_i2.p1 TRINITY_DN10501_c0_g1~~TRINITY_DN10501_c0_g1_i2.p1  ORF type:complete len:224 (-),score=17.78 TRINITY_DN10501_c0_g1_i2:166-837(-)